MWEYIKVAFCIFWEFLIYSPRIRKYAKHPEKYPLEERFYAVKKILKKLVDKWPCFFHVTNIEKFQNYEGKRLIVMNHLSLFDSLAFISQCTRPTCFVAKKEAEKYFLVGTYVKALGGLFLDRENLMNQVRTLNDAMKIAKDPNGPDIVIYPEGTRNKVPGTRCLDFHPGTFKIAMKAGVAIFPVSIYGAFRVLDTKIHMKKYPIFATCFDPILPSEYADKTSYEIAAKVQEAINGAILEAKKADLEEVSSYKLSKKMRAKVEEPDRIEF